MKNTVRTAIAVMILLAAYTVSGFAQRQDYSSGDRQNRQNRQVSAWMDKMKSDKIAFLSSEIGLTPSEAEKFWPIYNQAEKEKEQSMGEVMKAYMELEKAVDDGKEGKDLTAYLEKYIRAQKTSGEIDAKYVEKYKKVISGEKVAKLFVAEEKFRRNQIMKLQRGGGNPYQPQR